MLKTIFMCLAVIMILGNVVTSEEIQKKTVPMPEGFDGISIGMSLPDFLKIRPQVRPGGLGPTHETEVDVTKPNQSLNELVKNDPLYNLQMAGLYTFRAGKLTNVLLVWSGDMEKVKGYRAAFLYSCKERWGNDFQRNVLKRQCPGEMKQEYLVPLLLWQKVDTMIAVECSEYEDMKIGGFMIFLFPEDDEENMSIFAGEKVDEELRKKLFKAIGINYNANEQDND